MQITYDTCVFIAYKDIPPPNLLSAVVVQELLAGAADSHVVKSVIALAKEFHKAGRLLVPDGDDWIEAGKILNNLLRGRRSSRKGRTPSLPAADKQRIIRDVLIARCAKRAGATLITDNLKDFAAISRYCNVKVRSGRSFFSS